MIRKSNKTFFGCSPSIKQRAIATLILRRLVLIVLLLAATFVAAAKGAEKRTLEVFVRDGCPHCAEAKLFLPKFADKRPEWLM